MSKGKFLVEAYKSYDASKVYNFNDAVDIILKNKRTKINETIEISLNLGVSTHLHFSTLHYVPQRDHYSKPQHRNENCSNQCVLVKSEND